MLPAGADALLECSLRASASTLRRSGPPAREGRRVSVVAGAAARRAWVAWRRRRRRGSPAEKGEIMEGSSAVGRQRPPGSSSSLPRTPPPPWAGKLGRGGGRRTLWPRKTGLNWFIPALMKSSVRSSCGTTGDDGQWVCAAARLEELDELAPHLRHRRERLRRLLLLEEGDERRDRVRRHRLEHGVDRRLEQDRKLVALEVRRHLGREARVGRRRPRRAGLARRVARRGAPPAARARAQGGGRELREDAAAFYQEGVGFAGISLIAALTASVRRSASFMLTTYAWLPRRSSRLRGLHASQTGLCLRADDDAAQARASMFAARDPPLLCRSPTPRRGAVAAQMLAASACVTVPPRRRRRPLAPRPPRSRSAPRSKTTTQTSTTSSRWRTTPRWRTARARSRTGTRPRGTGWSMAGRSGGSGRRATHVRALPYQTGAQRARLHGEGWRAASAAARTRGRGALVRAAAGDVLVSWRGGTPPEHAAQHRLGERVDHDRGYHDGDDAAFGDQWWRVSNVEGVRSHRRRRTSQTTRSSTETFE